jgi:hypothetical protein
VISRLQEADPTSPDDVFFMIDSGTQHELETRDQATGEQMGLVDAGIQPSASMFYKVRDQNSSSTTNLFIQSDKTLHFSHEISFLTDSTTQHEPLFYNTINTQTSLETSTAHSQTDFALQSSHTQTDSQAADASSQTSATATTERDAQTELQTKTSVTQTSIQMVDASVGASSERAERGIQPEISMFRLEDVKSKDEGGSVSGRRKRLLIHV